ncbi:acyltransferase [Nesterenkonia flava]
MQWMDLLRGLAVILVVILHVNTHGGASVQWWTDANRHLTPFRMPLLMFLSGMLLQRSLAKPLPIYAWGKIAAIGWPLVVWLLLYGVFVRTGISWPQGTQYWITGDYLWFLMALLACYLIASFFKPLAVRFPQTHTWLYLGVFVLMVYLYIQHEDFRTSMVWYGSFFFLGAWAGGYVQKWVKAHWLIVVPMLIACAYFAHLGVEERALRVGTFEAAGVSALGIAVILWIAPRIPRVGPVRFVEWAGRSSIVVYVAHFPVIVLLRDYVFSRLELGPGAHVMLLTLCTLALTLLLVWARPWTPWLYTAPGHQWVAARLR